MPQRSTLARLFSGALCGIAQALGGSAAARLSAKLGMPISRDTLLRAMRRQGGKITMAPPVVVGIDDWAITRGHRYGTIMVDLERRCVIEVLDGRESTSVAEWLQRHPSNQVVARDRAGAYSDAAESAIPRVQQVADRWHLLVNLRETPQRAKQLLGTLEREPIGPNSIIGAIFASVKCALGCAMGASEVRRCYS